ncbi:hypothetical protein OROMI_030823 [Orobanche minor]
METCMEFHSKLEEQGHMRRAGAIMMLMQEEQEGGSTDPESLRCWLEDLKMVRKPRTCNVCLQPPHRSGRRCPLMKSADEDSVVGPYYRIICKCCRKENAHPGDKSVRRYASMKYCGRCCESGDHTNKDCSRPPRKGCTPLRKDD